MTKENATVKIKPNLLEKVKTLLKDEKKGIIYSSSSHFVNVAVLEKLQKEFPQMERGK